MTEREDIVTAIVAAAPGGELIGRVRLQKTAYLLERLGFKAALRFEYHHYGPYSRELDNATGDAKAFGMIEEKLEHRSSDGALFSRFQLASGVEPKAEIYRALGRARVGQIVADFAGTNVTVLELAATVDWLIQEENVRDWRAEITKRKGKKVLGGRLERAVALLGTLGLAPPDPLTAAA